MVVQCVGSGEMEPVNFYAIEEDLTEEFVASQDSFLSSLSTPVTSLLDYSRIK